jgi:hypothetical protein
LTFPSRPSAGRGSSGGGRDLLIFDVITLLGIVHFLLKTSGTTLWSVTVAYALMWGMSLVILLMLRVYGGPSGQRGDVVDYDENILRSHLPWLFGSVALIAIVNMIAAAGAASAGLQFGFSAYVLRPSLASGIGYSATVLDDVLYNFILIAQAEESVKLVATLALYRRTGNLWFSAGIPIGVWSAYHGYMAYAGGSLDFFLVSAFVSGIILLVVILKTKSLINAVVSHGIWDSIVILSTILH